MPENRESLLQHYRDMRAALLAAIDGLTDEQLSEPSLDGWSVKDHLAHIAVWDDIRAGEVARISAGYESAWPVTGHYEAHNALIHTLLVGLSAGQVKWELASSRQRLLKAISFASERGLDGSQYREAGLRSTHEAAHTVWIKRWRAERGI